MCKKNRCIIGIVILVMGIMSMARWRVLSESDGYIFDVDTLAQINDCQSVIVLGASILRDGSMSPILKERAMTVVDLYNKGKVCHVIISGDRHVDQGYVHDEVAPVREYLIAQGVPVEIIVVDGDGYDTFSSMKNVRNTISSSSNNIIVVTQSFHLPRAVYIGRTLGMNVVGFRAYKFTYPHRMEKYKDLLREWPAAVKAVWQTELNN